MYVCFGVYRSIYFEDMSILIRLGSFFRVSKLLLGVTGTGVVETGIVEMSLELLYGTCILTASPPLGMLIEDDDHEGASDMGEIFECSLTADLDDDDDESLADDTTAVSRLLIILLSPL